MGYVFRKPLRILLVSIVDRVGYVIFLFIRIAKRNPPPCPQKILVVRLDHIGDFVCTTPLFRNIKAYYPSAHITALVNPAVKDLATSNPSIDQVMTFSPFWFKGRRSTTSFRDFFNLARIIEREQFDIGFDPRGDFFAILLMFLGRVRYRVGYGVTGGGFLLHREAQYQKDKHIIERNLDVLRTLDIPVKENRCEVFYQPCDREVVGEVLGNIGYQGEKALVLHPFAGTSAKQWPHQRFYELIKKIKSTGLNVFVVGESNDSGVYGDCFDVRGKFNLPQLACLIQRIGTFVGLDSGPANIAAALGVVTVVISSGVNIAQQWIPDGGNLRFVFKGVSCKPCENVCCSRKHECMEAISVEEVFGAVVESGKALSR